MTDFDFDVKEKKSIARGAFARKGGSKSKKCSLPSDLLTPAQKRKLNGPCTSVKLGAPMSWEEFKALPRSLAEEYLTDLRDTYDVTQRMLAQMFGVHFTRVGKVVAELGLSNLFSKKRVAQETAALRQAKWDAFCNGVVGGGDSTPEDIDPDLLDYDEPALLEEEDISETRAENFVRATAPKTTNLCATFDGFPDLATLESFYRLFGTNKVKVTINIEVMDHA